MRIALLTPSRERIEQKRLLIDSIVATASSLNNLTLYFGIDLDDPTRESAYALASEFSFVRIVDIDNKGKYIGMGNLWNLCANASTEEILAMIGDDMCFRTPGWDVEMLKEFSGDNLPADHIKMVYCKDGIHNGRMAVNPFLHRGYVAVVGWYARPEFLYDYIDTWIHHVLRDLGRVVYRDDIFIEHKQRHGDSTGQRVRKATTGNELKTLFEVTLRPERLREVELFKDYIECCRKKVISFSLFGDAPMYVRGMLENARLTKEIYPGWVCRVYTNHKEGSDIVKNLRAEGAEIVVVDEPAPCGCLWRFYVADDKTVGRFIVRDCDSRLSLREKLAVDEWIVSGKGVHSMWDHPNHTKPLMGGMWGAVGGRISGIRSLAASWLARNPQVTRTYIHSADECFLAEMVVPLVKGDILRHSPWHKDQQPFPCMRDGGAFVGEIQDENGVPKQSDRIVLTNAIKRGQWR